MYSKICAIDIPNQRYVQSNMPNPCATMGSMLRCSFGAMPVPLIVIPSARVVIGVLPAAAIIDNKPFVNIITFGICTSPANPAFAACSAVGAPTPCIPMVPGPWIPMAPTVLLGGFPILTTGSTALCAYAGVITVQVSQALTTA